MDIFYKRPLSLILCILLGGFCLFSLLPKNFILLGFLLLLLFILLIAPRAGGRWVCLFAISALLISLLSAALYPTYFRLNERFSGTVKVEAVVTEVYSSSYNEAILDIRTKRIDGSACGAHKLKMYLTPSEAQGLSEGAIIRFDGKFLPFENSGSFDAERYYASRGFSSQVSPSSKIEIIGHRNYIDFDHLRELIARKTIMQSGEESASLFIALFTGERDLLSENLRLDFTRLGINHVLALSGMHLAILSALLEKLLCRISLGKKPRLIIIAAIVLFYMAMTGFSASVTRAGIMLVLTSITYHLSSPRDSFTSLCIAVFLIVLAEPYSITDLGLWLSALATLGVIAAAELGRRKYKRWCYRPEPREKRILRRILTAVLVTLFAINATLLLSVSSFSGISPLSVVTTPVFSFLAEIYIYLGLAALVTGSLIPIGILLQPMYAITAGLASFISEWEGAYFSSSFTAVKIIIVISTIAFFSFLVLKFRQKILCVAVVISILISVFAVAGTLTLSERSREILTYRIDERSECILMRAEETLAILDLSCGTASSEYTLRSALEDAYTVEAEYLVFAYYTANLPEKAEAAAGAFLTHRIYLSRPRNEKERRLADAVEAVLENSHTELCYYTDSIEIKLGDFTLTRLYASEYGDGAPRSAMTVERDGETLLYLSSGIMEDKTGADVALDATKFCEHLIFGMGGKSYKTDYIFSAMHDGIKTLILAGQRLRLTQDALAYYENDGRKFYLRPDRVDFLP